MKRQDLFKKTISSLLMVTLTGGLILFSGCAKDTDDGRGDNITLIDPVGVKVSTVSVQRRNIYDVGILAAYCCPKITESSFESDIWFSSYDCMPGETVKEGDVLVSGDTTDLDKQIKSQAEKIANMQSDHDYELEKLNDSYEKDKEDYKYYTEIMENLNDKKPADDDPALEEWLEKNKYSSWDGKQRYAYVQVLNDELAIKEKNELFDLDLKHEKAVLNRLQAQKKSKQLIANADGVIVGLNYFESSWVSKNTPGMAIGDMENKEIRCSYISQGTYNKAQEVYAIANGKRYELEFHPINNQEYDMLNKANGNVYSTFTVEDPNNEIAFGDYLVIALVNDVREDVLAVPKSAVGTGADGSFVHVFDGENYTEKLIRTGLSDGAYIEVLSGLEEGENVKCEFKMKSGAREEKLSKGSISYTFSDNGFLFYPGQKNVTNPVKYGVTYFDELCVSRYEQVEEGQVIAKVHVVADQVEIDRTKRSIQRLNESMAELQENLKKQTDAGADKFTLKDIQRNIDSLQKQIDEANKTYREMTSNAALTEIKAPVSGIMTDIHRYQVGDIIDQNATIATVSDESSCFVIVEDSDGRLSYGNTAEVSYKDTAGASKTAEGLVVTANPMVLSRGLKTGYALIKLDPEIIGEMAVANRNADGWWSQARFGVKSYVRKMDNVLLVPRSAVTEISGTSYVTVKDDNGSLRMVSFVPGGSDSSYYWVLEGLEEGQTICWE